MINRLRTGLPITAIALSAGLLGCQPPNLPNAGNGDTVDCYWDFSVTDDARLQGSNATHFNLVDPVFLQITLFQPGSSFLPAGTVQFTRPAQGSTNLFDAVVMMAVDGRIWQATNENGTSATVFDTGGPITTNEQEYEIRGVCETVIDGESVLRDFTLRLRSANGDFGSPGCTGF